MSKPGQRDRIVRYMAALESRPAHRAGIRKSQGSLSDCQWRSRRCLTIGRMDGHEKRSACERRYPSKSRWHCPLQISAPSLSTLALDYKTNVSFVARATRHYLGREPVRIRSKESPLLNTTRIQPNKSVLWRIRDWTLGYCTYRWRKFSCRLVSSICAQCFAPWLRNMCT